MTEIRKCLRDFFPYLHISALFLISTWGTQNGTERVNFVQTFSENSITLGVLLEERPGAGGYIIKRKV